MNGGGLLTRVHVKRLGDGLCGASRPGHFDGVCTVVYKLLNIIQPDVAYFGEKDYQQLVIVRRMVRDLSLPVEIVGCPIIRDADGLALSSRNAYLTADERKRAPVIHEALQAGSERVQAGTRVATDVIDSVARMLRQRVDTVEYVALVDAETLAALELIDRPARLCVAVRFGRTRLIDNVALDASAGNH
jgi:pantoate--beta-alanine ligase